MFPPGFNPGVDFVYTIAAEKASKSCSTWSKVQRTKSWKSCISAKPQNLGPYRRASTHVTGCCSLP